MASPIRILTIPGAPAVGANLPKLQRPRTVIASDGFSGSTVADINGRAADLAFGGSAFTWVAGPATTMAKTQALVRGATTTGTAHAGGSLGSTNGRLTFKINELPSTNVYLDIRKNVYEDSATSRSSYRLQIAAAGTCLLQKRVSGTGTNISSSVTYAVNDTLGIDVYNTTISIYRNGILAVSVTDASVTTGTLVDVVLGASATAELDNMVLETYAA